VCVHGLYDLHADIHAPDLKWKCVYTVQDSVSQPPGRSWVPGPGINYTGPSPYKKRIYQAAVSQKLRITGVRYSFLIHALFLMFCDLLCYKLFFCQLMLCCVNQKDAWNTARDTQNLHEPPGYVKEGTYMCREVYRMESLLYQVQTDSLWRSQCSGFSWKDVTWIAVAASPCYSQSFEHVSTIPAVQSGGVSLEYSCILNQSVETVMP
jgi:hypothetical protein